MDENKDLDRLMDKIFEADNLENPSLEFTSKVLDSLAQERQATLTYKPLLPSWVLGLVLTSFIIFVAYVLGTTEIPTTDLNYVDSINSSTQWFTNTLTSVDFSQTLGLVVLAVGILICIQATVLNRFFGKTTLAA